MSQARKAISQFLKGHVTRGLRSCLDASELRLALLRERERSDRRDIPFSVLIFQSSRRTELETETASKILFDRLRLTDEVGILDSSNLGILLPDTESDAACHLAAELKIECSAVLKQLQVEVFTYPFQDTDFDEELGPPNSVNDQKVQRRKKFTEATEAEPSAEIQPNKLSFAMPMPLWKRTLDVIVSLGTLILLAPFFLLTAIIIKLTSPGPIFFTQWREGKGGQKFKIYKFRTMQVNAESLQQELRHLSEQDGPAFKMEKDPRLNWFGSFLRKSCFDETPQFFNILKGDMTLVGPRPLPVNESQACTSWQRRRLDVTPGMTCIWQVNGDRHVSFEEWMRMDEEYIRTASISTDIKILFQTAWFVILRRASV